MYPKDRRYSTQHEWVAVDDGVARIGITDYAQQELGDIVYVELPDVGREVKAGDTLGTIESVKAVSEIYAPIGGKVESVNDALTDGPEVVNSDPHDKGWYCTMSVTDPAEVESLMEAAAYAEFVGKAKAD